MKLPPNPVSIDPDPTPPGPRRRTPSEIAEDLEMWADCVECTDKDLALEAATRLREHETAALSLAVALAKGAR